MKRLFRKKFMKEEKIQEMIKEYYKDKTKPYKYFAYKYDLTYSKAAYIINFYEKRNKLKQQLTQREIDECDELFKYVYCDETIYNKLISSGITSVKTLMDFYENDSFDSLNVFKIGAKSIQKIHDLIEYARFYEIVS